MTYVITENCLSSKDRSCLAVCPVDCIHEASQMLVIDPNECIDCGACEPECPVEAIFHEDDVPPASRSFIDINAAIGDGIERVDGVVDAYLTPGAGSSGEKSPGAEG